MKTVEKPNAPASIDARKRPRRAPAARLEAGPARPFLKWAGGKRQLLPELKTRAPKDYGTYHEPFLGGGALFFALRPARAVLADTNVRLVRAYAGVRDSVDDVIRLLETYPHDRAFFERMRQRDIDAATDAEVAAWLIYLNRVGYNGLYRVNRKNEFNVPFGRHSSVTICQHAVLHACARALRDAELRVEDFAAVGRRAKKGDFVYFDPPYVPLSRTSSFTAYTSASFGAADQERLCEVALRLKRRGVHVLLSNSSAARSLYRDGFTVVDVSATRLVNSKATGRGPIVEIVVW